MLRTFRAHLRVPLLALSAAAAITVAACEEVTAPLEDPASTTYAPALGVNIGQMTRTASGLYVQTLVSTSGAVADTGHTVTAYYVGYLTNGRQFDSNRGTGRPITFQLGRGQVIKGWDEGVRGMRVGERRRLVVPPQLGYGGSTSGIIPAGSVLVFEIDLVSTTPPTTTTSGS
ncbi:FKBP-type peptidyl-prolyl cis-trans isomerase [Roseisolibacter agri]|uniref:Peptidyl-prolyl cis-trans isomerase n=1 Tax=Roseisolibacter agri TaxID=2014610 RepID=A0AA37QGD0_9BACT|nr:FKBP-type peptidyl-prolyl cis-trans isomerase [Roseisolibacter agri]GLC26298.1 peptidyl-prolyl cis-trans isomerase [Roseisolibacter agri]